MVTPEKLIVLHKLSKKFPKSKIVPTENDIYFRKQLIQGYVHDQGAALFGGIALHAGLFANAIDLMKLMQFYLDGGKCGNKYLINKALRKWLYLPGSSNP